MNLIDEFDQFLGSKWEGYFFIKILILLDVIEDSLESI